MTCMVFSIVAPRSIVVRLKGIKRLKPASQLDAWILHVRKTLWMGADQATRCNGRLECLQPASWLAGWLEFYVQSSSFSTFLFGAALQRKRSHLDRKSTRLNSSHLGISYA